MPDQLIQVKATMPAKLTLLAVVSLAVVSSWFVVRAYVGNTIAEYFQAEDQRIEMAQVAVALAPKDPFTHWRLANLIQKERPPDQISQSVAEYEQAVSLSPNDYRLWMDLGAALEQAGEAEKAEKALRQAVKLAPSYSYPRWLLGNLFLRSDRYPEAFAELRMASEGNNEFQSQLFNVAWQLNKGDFESLISAVGNAPTVHAEFSKYLIEHGRFDEGLRLWDTLAEMEKRENRSTADSIIGSLIQSKRFHDAMEVWNDIAPGISYRAQLGHIIDGGFEDDVAHSPGAVFGWQVEPTSQLQIGIDAGQGHSSSRSLRIFFQVRSHLDEIKVSQLVPVQPDTQYDFDCYVKTEKLQSAATPIVSIADAGSSANLATSAPATDGSNDWQRIGLSFKTGAKTEAIKIQVDRGSCGENQICPIFGTVWYDDFNLKPGK
jgi:hypothetical protein